MDLLQFFGSANASIFLVADLGTFCVHPCLYASNILHDQSMEYFPLNGAAMYVLHLGTDACFYGISLVQWPPIY